MEVKLKTPRGSVTVDVHAIDGRSVDKIKYIFECKNWNTTVPQSVVHSFVTVMQETGANIGVIVSRYGLQSGALEYTTNTNIKGMTYEELQHRYLDVWWRKYFCVAVRSAADAVTQYVEPINTCRERFLKELSLDSQMLHRQLQERYADFGMLMWLTCIDYQLPSHGDFRPPGVDFYRNYVSNLLGGDDTFKAMYYRDFLTEVCTKLKDVESEFNAIFGKNIFVC